MNRTTRLLLLLVVAGLVSGCYCKRMLGRKAHYEGRLRGVCTELEYAEDDVITDKLLQREVKLRMALADLYERYCGRRCKEDRWVRNAPSCEEIGAQARERAASRTDAAQALAAEPATAAPAEPSAEEKARAAVEEMQAELDADTGETGDAGDDGAAADSEPLELPADEPAEEPASD